jgi:hypothetical protein
MKKTDCKHYQEVVEGYRRQTGDELIDEVCHLDPNNPKHHNEYECEGCPFYEQRK